MPADVSLCQNYLCRYREALSILYEARPFQFNTYAELGFFATSIPLTILRHIRSTYIFWEVHPQTLSISSNSNVWRSSILTHMDGLRKIKVHLHSRGSYLVCQRHAEAFTLPYLYNRTRNMRIEILVPINWREGCQHPLSCYEPILDGLDGQTRIQQARNQFAWLELPPETVNVMGWP